MAKSKKQKKNKKKSIKCGGASILLPTIVKTIYNPLTKFNSNHRNTTFSNKFTKYSVNKYREETTDIINKTIDIIISTFLNTDLSSYTQTDDYRDHGLIPGQQIAYGGGFGISVLKHYGIYIGDGLVYELAPQSENLNIRIGPEISIGISTLHNFVEKGQNKPSPIYTFDSSDMPNDNKVNIKNRLDRVLDMNLKTKSRNKQLLLYGNCEHIANKIAYNRFTSVQADIISGLIITSILLYKGNKFTSQKIELNKEQEAISCRTYNTTKAGCICDTSPKFSLYGSTCNINPAISCNIKNFRPGKIESLVKQHKSKYSDIFWGVLGEKSNFKLTIRKRKISKKKYKHFYKWKQCY